MSPMRNPREWQRPLSLPLPQPHRQPENKLHPFYLSSPPHLVLSSPSMTSACVTPALYPLSPPHPQHPIVTVPEGHTHPIQGCCLLRTEAKCPDLAPKSQSPCSCHLSNPPAHPPPRLLCPHSHLAALHPLRFHASGTSTHGKLCFPLGHGTPIVLTSIHLSPSSKSSLRLVSSISTQHVHV